MLSSKSLTKQRAPAGIAYVEVVHGALMNVHMHACHSPRVSRSEPILTDYQHAAVFFHVAACISSPVYVSQNGYLWIVVMSVG